MSAELVRTKRRLRGLRTALIVVGSLIVLVALVIFAGAYFVLGAFHDNKAQDAVSPLARELTALGGHEICDTGDAGYGPDNNLPWYYVWYRVPDAAAARKAFFAKAAADGYPLATDKHYKQRPTDESFTSDPSDDSGLSIDIYRNTRFSPTCYVDNRKVSTSGNGAIYGIYFFSSHR
jgi:hypothetical protein